MQGPEDGDKELFKDHLRQLSDAAQEFSAEQQEKMNNKIVTGKVVITDLGERMLFMFLLDMRKHSGSEGIHRELVRIFMTRMWPETKDGIWEVRIGRDKIEILQHAEDNING